MSELRWAVASDHAGFPLKEEVKRILAELGISPTDLGTHDTGRTDYPDWGHKMGEAIARGDFDRGVLTCGTGIGISIAANRHKFVRAALCNEVFMARMARAHNDANVLAMGARVIGVGVAEEVVRAFVSTAFEGARHGARVTKIDGTTP